MNINNMRFIIYYSICDYYSSALLYSTEALVLLDPNKKGVNCTVHERLRRFDVVLWVLVCARMLCSRIGHRVKLRAGWPSVSFARKLT